LPVLAQTQPTPTKVVKAKDATRIELKTPRGGWRSADDHESSGYLQEVYYPASSVNIMDRSGRNKFYEAAKIEGRIHSAVTDAKRAEQRNAKKRQGVVDEEYPEVGTSSYPRAKPHTLIVNGVNMPLEVAEDGMFSRPYAFGRGSNSVEIRSPDGKLKKRSQFYEANQQKTQAKLRVVLSWDSPNTDIDLHVVSPDGQHVFYANRVVNNGGAQDVDVTTGYGPEIYSNATPPHGIYYVFVYFYGQQGDDSVDGVSKNRVKSLTMATITVITNENTPNEKQQTFQVPMRKVNDLKRVASFVY
jgi:uncharacterized protein YfaP (DUF2135 family)